MNLSRYQGYSVPPGVQLAPHRPLELNYVNLTLVAGITDAIMSYRHEDGTFSALGCPQGEIWVCTHCVLEQEGTIVATSYQLIVKDALGGGGGLANYHVIFGKKAPVTLEWYTQDVLVMVLPGQSIRAYFNASTAGNDGRAFVHGFVHKLAGVQ